MTCVGVVVFVVVVGSIGVAGVVVVGEIVVVVVAGVVFAGEIVGGMCAIVIFAVAEVSGDVVGFRMYCFVSECLGVSCVFLFDVGCCCLYMTTRKVS